MGSNESCLLSLGLGHVIKPRGIKSKPSGSRDIHTGSPQDCYEVKGLKSGEQAGKEWRIQWTESAKFTSSVNTQGRANPAYRNPRRERKWEGSSCQHMNPAYANQERRCMKR